MGLKPTAQGFDNLELKALIALLIPLAIPLPKNRNYTAIGGPCFYRDFRRFVKPQIRASGWF
jgi:hypothetical protein